MGALFYVSEGKVYEYNLDNDSKNIIIDSNDKNNKFEISVPPIPTIDNGKKVYIFCFKRSKIMKFFNSPIYSWF